MKKATLQFDHMNEAREVYAALEGMIKKIEKELSIELHFRDLTLTIQGQEIAVIKLEEFIQDIRSARDHGLLDEATIQYAYTALLHGEKETFKQLEHFRIDVSKRKPAVFPKTMGQQIYLNAIRKNTITFGLGPAGTGKTYLAMAMAVSALLKEEVSRIVLTRPALEAGENLGFLPGDFQKKVAPYLRPLQDALYDMLPAETIENYIERGIIEVAPLAYMRGRTLNHAFVILDEAQNTTPQQMLMFLTRLGYDSKCAITGDLTQTDLPNRSASGLREARLILDQINGLEIIELSDRDVVRHPLVQEIIKAYQTTRSA